MSVINWTSRHWVPRLFIACVAVLCAEGFLSLVLSRTMENSLWFTGEIHDPDPKYAFRFAPNYAGWMRFKNELFLEGLELDDRGDRMPKVPPVYTQEIVLIGGYSMAFSYGVPDSATIHHVLGDHLSRPALVRNTAWPGFDLYRNFHIYREQVKGTKPADIAVLLFFQDDLWSFSDIPEQQDEFIDTKPHVDLFTAFKRHACAPPDDPIKRAFSTLYYQSIICHKLADRAATLTSMVSQRIGTRQPSPGSPPHTPPTELGRERLRSFTAHVCAYFGGKDHVLFVVLPGMQPQRNVDELLTGIMPDAHVLDLNRTSNDTIARTGTFALGHYTAPSCAYVGEQIAKAVDELPVQ